MNITRSRQIVIYRGVYKALRKNLVSIYDYADIFEFSNFKEQDEFAEQWYSSL